MLEQLSHACHFFQKHARGPLRLKIRLPDEVAFNGKIRIYLVHLEGNPVLHGVNVGTTFNAAVFLPASDAISVFNAFVKGWSRPFLGDLDRIVEDQGSVFRAKKFVNLCSAHEILL